MIVNGKTDTLISIKELKCGDVFKTVAGEYWLKTDKVFEYKKYSKEKIYYFCGCVHLTSGHYATFSPDDKVLISKVELVIN